MSNRAKNKWHFLWVWVFRWSTAPVAGVYGGWGILWSTSIFYFYKRLNRIYIGIDVPGEDVAHMQN